jgi:prevent-host-death family protein
VVKDYFVDIVATSKYYCGHWRAVVATAGIKDLKDHLSDFLRRVRRGEEVVITDRNRPVARLSAVDQPADVGAAWTLVRGGRASWAGGKPSGAARPPRPRGKSVAQMVLEDRR